MNGRAFQFRDSQEGLGRFFLALVVFFAAFLLEIRLAAVIPIEPSFLLAGLIALTFFLDFWEVLFLGLLAALFLGYQPVLRPESILVAILPLLMAGATRIIFPFTRRLSHFFVRLDGFFYRQTQQPQKFSPNRSREPPRVYPQYQNEFDLSIFPAPESPGISIRCFYDPENGSRG